MDVPQSIGMNAGLPGFATSSGRAEGVSVPNFVAVHESAYGTKRDITIVQSHVRFWG
jgi:hypothetical protein